MVNSAYQGLCNKLDVPHAPATTDSKGEGEKKIVETLWLSTQLIKDEHKLMERYCLKEKG